MTRLVLSAFVAHIPEIPESPWWAPLPYRSSPVTGVAFGPLRSEGTPDEPLWSRRDEQGRRGNSAEVVYYASPRIVVTSLRIDSETGHYLIRELSAIDRVHHHAREARTVAVICGAVELVVGATLAVAYRSVLLLGLGLLLAAGLITVIMRDERRNPRWMALRAAHRGGTATLFSSADRQEFESVRRAVVRAVEANRVPRL